MNPEVAAPVTLFFAFPDGAFDYVCNECDALCCKGQGFGGSLNREMGFLLDTYPSLANACASREQNMIHVASPRGRCFFLGDSNLCRIETVHGRARKPGVCVAFPFNRFRRVGQTVMVMPHYMCPLCLHVPAIPGKAAGTHSLIEAALGETQLLEPGYVSSYFEPSRTAGDPDEILQRETFFRDACAKALGNDRYDDVVWAHSTNPAGLTTFVENARQLMNWKPLQEGRSRDYLDDTLLAIASSVRAELLALPDERVIRVLALAGTLLRSLAGLSQGVLQVQAAHSLVQQALPVLTLLSFDNENVELLSPSTLHRLGDSDLLAAACSAMLDMHSLGVMASLKKAFAILSSGADKTVLAQYLAEHLPE